jgi:hypothetical protein
MKKIIDRLTGESKHYEKAYRKLFGNRDHSAEIKRVKRDALKKYLYLVFSALVILTAYVAHEILVPDMAVTTEDERGVSILRPAEGEAMIKIPMKLDALLEDDEKLSTNVTIQVRPVEAENAAKAEENDEESLYYSVEDEINKAVKMLNRSSDGDSIVLPSELPGGIRLFWEESRSSKLPLLLSLFALIAFVLYQGRYSRLKKTEVEAKESIIKDLPEFINKLLLLMNAGLVLSSAFDRIMEKYKTPGREVKSYFYSQLLMVSRSTRETNSPMIEGLKDFAGRSGVRDFMRVVSIISDNVDKGTELVGKLQSESELLWLTKRKLAEEKGRLAESKLTFPLVILLLSLISVTIAPALMEM